MRNDKIAVNDVMAVTGRHECSRIRLASLNWYADNVHYVKLNIHYRGGRTSALVHAGVAGSAGGPACPRLGGRGRWCGVRRERRTNRVVSAGSLLASSWTTKIPEPGAAVIAATPPAT
jgi:hypothetical protein